MQRPDDGVAPGWWGTDGAWHDVDPSSAAALRAAQRDDDSESSAPVPTWFVRTGEEPALSSPGVVRLEDGTELQAERRLPAGLPLGAHALAPADGGPVTNLFVVAPRSPRPSRQWGWSTQLYATRSRASWGSGDLADLADLARWAATSGAGMLAHSPLGATLPIAQQQPSPYSPSSRRFWSPAYLRVEDVAAGLGVAVSSGPLAAAADAGRALDDDRRIDRDEIWRLKIGALEHLWDRARGGDRCQHLLAQADDDELVQRFAVFCAIAERFGSGWSHWPQQLRHPDNEAVRVAAEEHRGRVEFWSWVQMETDAQLAAAGRAGATLMADLPVGFDRDGFDAWVDQDLLALDWSVGAPPDEFNALGQDWGLPPFVPSRLRDAGYRPWIDTLRRVLRHAGALRVDHVMGLFRLFWIPLDGDARSGGYVQQFGTELLDLAVTEAARAGAVLIGEDLGTVEEHVRDSLAQREVFGYRIAWFEDDPPSEWPASTLGSLSTHDLPTVAGLWTGADEADRVAAGLAPDPDGAEMLRCRLAAMAGVDPPTDAGAARASLHEVRLRAHERLGGSGSDVVLAPLEDAIGVWERTNLPGTVDEHPNWRLALPVPIEDLDAAGAAEVAAALGRGTDRRAAPR